MPSLSKFDPDSNTGNVYESFCDFIDEFQYEYDAVAKEPPKETCKTEEEKAAWVQINKRKVFLGKYCSRGVQKVYEEVTKVEERPTMTFDNMVTKLKTRYKGGSNTTLANFKFHKLTQNPSEGFDTFSIRVKREAEKCDFTCDADNCTVKNILIRDQIIFGTNSDEIRRHALKDQWDLNKLINHGRSLESADAGISLIKKEESSEFEAVRRTKPGKYSKKYSNTKNDSRKVCSFCSSSRCSGSKKCPARDMTCFVCNKRGHFRGAQACDARQRMKKSTRRLKESSSESSSSEEADPSSDSGDRGGSSSESDSGKVNFLRKKHVTKIRRMRKPGKNRIRRVTPRYEVEVVVKEKKIKAYADTGADICIMSKSKATELNLPIQKSKMAIKPYGSRKMKCVGKYIGTIMYGESVSNTSIYVIDQKVETLLSGAVCEDLGIITYNPKPNVPEVNKVTSSKERNNKFYRLFPKVFTGVGALKGYQVKFHVDKDVRPVAQPARQVPFHLRAKFDREIKNMEAEGIIEEHEGPAPWISNVVLAPKDDGQVRVTLDMKRTNKAIKATNIPIPRIEDIKSTLAGSKSFSKLDFKTAYHQLELDEESRKLTVFHAGNRLMKYKRLTMGTKPAAGELTKALQPLFLDMKKVHLIHDDLIIATESDEQNEEILMEVLKRIKESGLTLKYEKCHFIQKRIPFWGVWITEDGIMPDPDKVKALKLASRPRSKEEVVSFLCMVQANKDFISNIALKSVHLRKLTKKNTQFVWDAKCEKEFKDLKKSFSSDILMRHFDPSMQTFISVDAHASGLSAILQQGKTQEDAKPVLLASRSTSPVESRYPQLDLEALAVDFALRRFRYYLLGGPPVILVTDHKPLVSIFADKRSGSIRSERIKLRHQDINYQVIWQKGKENPADYLSRHAIPLEDLPQKIVKETKELEKTIWFVQYSPYTEAVSMENIVKKTMEDKSLKKLKRQVHKGYIPKTCKELAPYRKVFEQITVSDEGIVLKGEKIILPHSLLNTAIRKAHQGGHPGINAMKRRIRSHFWVPKLSEAIEKFVKGCEPCLLFTPKYTKECIHPQRVPEKAWEEVSIDLFGPMPDNKHILVVTDNMSRFPDAKIVPSTDSKSVLPALEETYTNFGQPKSHRTDNGPPFNSRDFEEFSKTKGIEHIKTFPYHPQANPAECFMKPLGKAMKSAFHTSQPREKVLNELLANYRATPHSATNLAPGNVVFRHGYKKDFPRQEVSDKELNIAREQDVSNKMTRSNIINQSNHRAHADLNIGDSVYIKNSTRKSKFQPMYGPEKCEVIESHSGGVVAMTGNGVKARRHLDEVKKIPGEQQHQSTQEVQKIPSGKQHQNTQEANSEDENAGYPQDTEEAPYTHEQPHQETVPRRSLRERRPNPKYQDFVLQ